MENNIEKNVVVVEKEIEGHKYKFTYSLQGDDVLEWLCGKRE